MYNYKYAIDINRNRIKQPCFVYQATVFFFIFIGVVIFPLTKIILLVELVDLFNTIFTISGIDAIYFVFFLDFLAYIFWTGSDISSDPFPRQFSISPRVFLGILDFALELIPSSSDNVQSDL